MAAFVGWELAGVGFCDSGLLEVAAALLLTDELSDALLATLRSSLSPVCTLRLAVQSKECFR